MALYEKVFTVEKGVFYTEPNYASNVAEVEEAYNAIAKHIEGCDIPVGANEYVEIVLSQFAFGKAIGVTIYVHDADTDTATHIFNYSMVVGVLSQVQ